VQVHVVPAVGVERLAPHGSFQDKASLRCYATRRGVGARMGESYPMQPEALEGPGGYGVRGATLFPRAAGSTQ